MISMNLSCEIIGLEISSGSAVGLNLFVINNLDRRIPMIETYKGALPFVASDVVRIVILVGFPGITLFLVRLLF